MDTKNPLVEITNKLSDSIDVYDVYNPAKDGRTVPYKYTKLASIAAGETKKVQTIHLASQLQAMFTGTIQDLNNFYFYQFPIKVMPAVQFSFDNPPPLKFTVLSSDKDAMVQSFLFHRFAMANPNSALTKNLYSALKKGSVTSINDFFSGTKSFSSCSLTSWYAVLTWLQMFTSGWQGPYYLYEKAPNPAPQGYVPTFVGTMNIVSTDTENSATLKLCSEDSHGNPVYPADPQTTTILMNGDGTMGDSDPGNDVSVNLTPVWMNAIQSTKKDGVPVTRYLSGPVVTGTVAGKTIVSSQTARQLPGKPAIKSKQSTFDSSFGKICQGVGLLVGLLMLGEFAQKIFSSAKKKIEKLKEKTSSEEDFNNGERTIDSTPNQEVVSEAASQESTFDSDSTSISETYTDISDALQKNIMMQTIEDTNTQIQNEEDQQLAEGYTPTQDYENAVSDLESSLEDAKTKIENNDFSEAGQELSDASASINQTLEQVSDSLAAWESQSLQKSSEAINDDAGESDALDSAQEDYDKSVSDESNDSGYNPEDDGWPETEEIGEL